MFEYFLDHPPADGWPPALQLLISAGAPLDAATCARFTIGSASRSTRSTARRETGGIAFDADDEIDDSGNGRHGRCPACTVDAAARRRLRRRTQQARARAQRGRRRRLRRTTTGDAFVDGGFLTGDYGAFDARGRLVLAGRVSSFINVAGRKVQPDEVERVLRAMPGVADVARGRRAPMPRRGQQIVACLVAARGRQ